MVDLSELGRELSSHSHNEDALKIIQTFCKSLKNTEERMKVWNSVNAIVQKPIDRNYVRQHGLDGADYDFALLQGDIIRTDQHFHSDSESSAIRSMQF